MGMIKIWFMAVPFVLLVACSSAEDAQPKPPRKTVFDPLTQQEQRARDVQKTIDATAERERKAIDTQEHGGDAP